MKTMADGERNTEHLLALYSGEVGVEMTLEQLIDSHRSQREIIGNFSNDLQRARREEVQKMYAGYDLSRISELRELINDLLDNYIDEVEQSKRRVGNEQQN